MDTPENKQNPFDSNSENPLEAGSAPEFPDFSGIPGFSDQSDPFATEESAPPKDPWQTGSSTKSGSNPQPQEDTQQPFQSGWSSSNGDTGSNGDPFSEFANPPQYGAFQQKRQAPPVQEAKPSPQAFVQMQAPVKERRVGTITLGLSLVAVGILLILGLFNPNFNLFVVAKFAPVILVFIGLEILISSFTSKGRKLKYDFLSMFVCFLLIMGSVCAALIPTYYQNTVLRDRLETRMSRDIQDDVYNALSSEGISSVDSWMYLEFRVDEKLREDMTYQDVSGMVQGGNLVLTLDDDFTDKAAFAQKAQTVLTKLNTMELPFERLELYSNNHDIWLYLDSHYQWQFSADKLSKLVASSSLEEVAEVE